MVFNVEKSYKKLLECKEKYENKTPNFGILGYVTFKRTYARYLPEKNRTEEWVEAIYRWIKGSLDLGTPYTEQEVEKLFSYMFDLKCLYSGRHMWQLGSPTVQKVGMDSLMNCWSFPIDNILAFVKIFDELMLGGGCGFSVEEQYISMLPVVKKSNVKFSNEIQKDDIVKTYCTRLDEQGEAKVLQSSIDNGVTVYDANLPHLIHFIGDSREGWVKALELILDSYFNTPSKYLFNFNLIREKGQDIKGFGGKSSGYEPLEYAFTKIVEILDNAVGRKLNSVEVLDIVCIIANCVVSGNVRRSALIAIGDQHDEGFLTYKRWDLGNVPHWRAMVNITINVVDIKDLNPLFKESYLKAGEAIGLLNRKNLKYFNRIGEISYDSDSILINPCGESSINNESCNLAEIFLPNVSNFEEFIDISKLLYKHCKTVTQGKYIYKDVEEKINKNSKIGIGITGIMQAREKMKWFKEAYNQLRFFDAEFSEEMGFSTSKKLTVIKPAGTTSLLAGCTAGIHPAYAKYYYRTMRIASNSPIWKVCRDNGCRVEDAITRTGTDENGNPVTHYDKNTKVVYFPCKTDDDTLLRKDVSAITQLEYVSEIQKTWVDQSISVTVYYTPENLDSIWKYLEENFHNFKTLSFLQDLHGFVQAPYIEISKEEYEEAVKNFTPVVSMGKYNDFETDLDDSDCSGGACPIR